MLAPKYGLTPITRSAERINLLVKQMPNCTKYLEIGVESGATFENVDVEFRTGVDPNPRFDINRLPDGVKFYQEESDKFFQSNQEVGFDLVFVDGLHQWQQAYRDLINSFNHSQPWALLLLDDCLPEDNVSALPSQEASLETRANLGQSNTRWCGDVFKVMFIMHTWHPELKFRLIVSQDQDGLQSGQCLVWRVADDESVKPHEFSDNDLALIDSKSWHSEFGDGSIPDYAESGIESEIIESGLNASANTYKKVLAGK